MFSRINLFGIVIDHLRTLRRYDSTSNSISFEDCCLFIIFPFSIAILLVIFNIKLDSHITDLITAISILGGFLFNLLAIIYGLIDKIRTSTISTENNSSITIRERIRQRFIREIHVNISFNIVMSLTILILLIVFSYTLKIEPNKEFTLYSIKLKIGLYINQGISFGIYFFLIIFSLTMLMIINRVYLILNRE